MPQGPSPKARSSIGTARDAGVAFVDPTALRIRASLAPGAGRVELHTGDYCAVRADRKEDGLEQLTHAADEAIAATTARCAPTGRRAAADSFAAMCGLAHEDAGFNLDMVIAAEALWRRAARHDHTLTAAIVELRAKLERQREAMLVFEKRFDALMAETPHDHLEPQPDDIARIRAALLGPDRATPPSVHAAS